MVRKCSSDNNAGQESTVSQKIDNNSTRYRELTAISTIKYLIFSYEFKQYGSVALDWSKSTLMPSKMNQSGLPTVDIFAGKVGTTWSKGIVMIVCNCNWRFERRHWAASQQCPPTRHIIQTPVTSTGWNTQGRWYWTKNFTT